MAQSPLFPDAFYRVTIKGLCVRNGKLLMIRETRRKDQWELPGGGLDFGEDIREGFNRETEEEMGLQTVKMSKSPVYVWSHKNERTENWFYSFVVAYRIELEHLDFTPSEECAEIRFFLPEELKTLKLAGQMTPLVEIFNPEDFPGNF